LHIDLDVKRLPAKERRTLSEAQNSDGFQTKAVPMLCAKNANEAIEFYKKAFSAVETMRYMDTDGRVGHAEFVIGGARFSIADEYPEIEVLSPETLGGSPVMILLEVEDVDALFNQAVAAGATVNRPVADQFGGAFRNGKLVDPFGHRWMLLTYNKDVPMPEMG
jgi:PhnB protein